MPLIRTERPAPSKTPYAILPSTFQPVPHGVGKVADAIWMGRKRGKTTVSIGTLRFWWQKGGCPTPDSTLEECKTKADSRYGGKCHARWDGEHLWVDPAHPLTPEQQVIVSKMLDEHLTDFPSLPEGYDGWYYLTNG